MGSGSSVPLNELSRLSNDAVYGPKIRDVFDMLDTDGSGSLDHLEIQTYMCVRTCFGVIGCRVACGPHRW